MDPHGEGIVINGATSQYDRWLAALDAGYARADGRTFVELLNFAPKFAHLINFYDLKDEIDGDWVEFFLTDPTMILASAGAADPAGIESTFTRLERLTGETQPFEQKFRRLREIFKLIRGLARLLDRWLQNLNSSPQGEPSKLLEQYLAAEIVNTLNAQLRLLIAYDLGAGLPNALGRAIGLNYDGFSPLWNLNNICADGEIYRGRDNDRKINHALPPLAQIFYPFYYAVADLKTYAVANLEATLGYANHKPHIALYITFVRLFKTAQDTINKFSGRYIDFYYRDLLRERYRAAIPDNVYLTFTLAEGAAGGRATVPRQTLFSAGQDVSGLPVLYAADKDLTVTTALIESLRTLRAVRGALLSGETPASPPADAATASPPWNTCVLKSVLESEITVGGPNTVETGTPQSWPTFGGTAAGAKGVEVTRPASLGFAVASSTLLLTGGMRTVAVNIRYRKKFWEDTLEPLLQELADATGLPVGLIFSSVLEVSFTLYVSTSAGWFPVQSYTVNLADPPPGAGRDDPTISLVFQLPPTIPPVVPYNPADAEGAKKGNGGPSAVSDDPEVNASNPSSSLPTLKAYLRQSPVTLSGAAGTVDVYPLSLLDQMPVTSFRVSAEVADLAPLTIENTDGGVDATKPFAVFGGLPVVGSYLLVRHTELFAKTLDGLQVGITWFNMPQTDDGFKGYYKDYVIGLDGKPACNLFNNAVFHGDISVQNPGTWSLSGCFQSPYVPPPDVDVLLFRTEPDCKDTLPAARLCARTDFDSLTVYPCAPPPYYDPAASAIKLKLTEPPYAFGNDLYAPNVLNSVMEALPQSEICEERCDTEWRVLKDAARCIQSCLESLSASPPDEETCFAECLECLFGLLVKCVEQCLPEFRGLPGPADTLNEIHARTKLLNRLPYEMWKTLLEPVKRDYSALMKEGLPACLLNCLIKGLSIIEAMVCVLECSWDAPPATSPPASASDCLKKCWTDLENAYNKYLTICLNDCISLKKAINYPNAPYLPQATGLTINYSSSCVIQVTGQDVDVGQLFHLLPFGGYRRLAPDKGTETPTLLPDFLYEGSLYLGFTGLVMPQTLTLLFQMAAGSDPNPAAGPTPVSWEYLSGNQWLPLPPAGIRVDTTNGLQNTGVLALSLPSVDTPAQEASPSTILSADQQWLRASVKEQAGQFPATINIHPHVLTATWQGEGAGEYLGKPLPPHTIKSSVETLPGIDTINQPIESFGGSPPETERTFKIRVGERLRHKERAILGWDYERLILERFPAIWKTQALPARTPDKGDAPGNVLAVVVPGPDSIGVTDPTVPQATDDMLGQIHTYLKGYMSPFIQLFVVNPVYVRITVTTVIQFRDEDDPGTSIERLNQDLINYLSPWFYDAARAARGASYVSEEDISEFVQTRPYVAAMISIGFEYDPPWQSLEWYFLTSAKQHSIFDAGS